MDRYLVTGGAGFIGSNLAKNLLKCGHFVRVVDNFSTGLFENIKDIMGEIELVCGDLADYRVARKSVEGVDYILHQAAIPSVPRSINDPIATNESIVTSTVNLFKAAVETGTIKRVVQASSSSVYGDTPTLPKKEDMIPNPMSPYAAAKYSQECYAKAFHKAYGLEILSLRYFNVFGSGQNPHSLYSSVVPKFINLMTEAKQPTIYGDGTASRDFTHIDNVIEANILACDCKWPGSPEVINIGCGEKTTLNELVCIINAILDTEIVPLYDKPRTSDVKESLADISKARALLGYEVKVDFYEGLKRTTRDSG